jgi:hypothetical protein
VNEYKQKYDELMKKKDDLYSQIKNRYLERLSGLLDTGFTGNIQINCSRGFPMNHNVNYTISLSEKERKQISDIFSEEKELKGGH